jgi:dynein heavy chain
LKFVLRTIANIQQESDTIEEAIRDVHERYRTIEMYKLEVTPEEREILASLQPTWASLFMSSKHRDVGLTIVKEKFTEITLSQISDFGVKLKAFAEKFAKQGPGSVGDDLDTGVKLLKSYKEELHKLEQDKQELTNAERLFNLPISSYAALTHVQKEMRALDELYKLYEEQKKSRQEWSETLWRDLDVQLLVDGIDNYIKTLKKMPRDVRSMTVAKTLENKMKSFKEALPLMTDLKHEALRERHWRQLMRETGIEFDMNPETFTLANLFAMELHRFYENIQNIVTSASKELQIEKVFISIIDIPLIHRCLYATFLLLGSERSH